MKKYQVLLYYLYVPVADPEKLRQEQLELCLKLNLLGRIIVSGEGINGTVEGLAQDTKKYMEIMDKDLRFTGMHFKKSRGTGSAFSKLSVKARDDIVSNAVKELELNPNQLTGKYLTPEELHGWIHSGRKFFMVDMRNDYETAVGYFKDSILAPFQNFRDLPKVLEKLESLKGETVVTVCTGGVRCEKASGFLIKNGFEDVYQLCGGIVSYMEKYPNEDFLGKLYVFDGRVTMGFNTHSPNHVIVGKCSKCNKSADTYYDCKNVYCRGRRHFISCGECIKKTGGFCSPNCPIMNKKPGVQEISQTSPEFAPFI